MPTGRVRLGWGNQPGPATGSRVIGAIHKQILVWQAEHPTITWLVWAVIWVVVFVLLFWPRRVA